MYNVGHLWLLWEIGFNKQEFSIKWGVYAIIWVFKTILIIIIIYSLNLQSWRNTYTIEVKKQYI